MKDCNVCKESKPLDAFSRKRSIKRDGRRGTCKSCVSKERNTTEYRAASAAYARKFRKAHLALHVQAQQKQDAKHPERRKARGVLRQAIYQGRIKRQSCVECGALKTHGHHEDYSKPLEVIWLCPLHHKQRHKQS